MDRLFIAFLVEMRATEMKGGSGVGRMLLNKRGEELLGLGPLSLVKKPDACGHVVSRAANSWR
jgi:hypothetical protein